MKKPLFLITVLILLTLSFCVPFVGSLDVSDALTGWGFQNGSAMFIRDASSFSYVEQIAGDNATFGDWVFLQKDGSSEIFGFYATGIDNVTVNSFFVNDVLELDVVGAGSVEVQVASRSAPSTHTGGVVAYSNTYKTVLVNVTSSGVVQLSWAGSPGGGGSNPQPTVTPHPSYVPTVTPSTKGLDLQDIDLGTVYPNGSVAVDLKFKFYGSNLSLKSISFTNPFSAWNVPLSSFTENTYVIGADGVGYGSVQLLFQIPSDVVFMDYAGSFTVMASDSGGYLKTDTASITALVSSGNALIDTINIFQAHPEYIVAVIVAVFVVLGLIVVLSRRR